MGDRPRSTPRAFLGLIAAIAIASVAGFLISRPQARALDSPLPLPSTAPPRANGPAPTADGALVVGYSVADDAATQQIVVFGGSAGADATWIWTNGAWRNVTPPLSPAGRFSAASAYDPQLRMVLLFGGELSPKAVDVNDTWGWDGIAWHELDSGASGPPGGGSASMAWDPGRDEMVLVTVDPSNVAFASETWIWSEDHWALGSINPRFPAPDTEISWDPASAELLAVTAYRSTYGGQITGTWRWDGSSWHTVVNPSEVYADALVGLSWDPASRSMVLDAQDFLGSSVPSPVMTWRWNGRTWAQLSIASAPPVLSGELVNSGKAVFLIGALVDGQGTSPPIHIWSWTGSAWTRVG